MMTLKYHKLLSFILFLACLCQAEAEQESSIPSIYGVRWFLGDHFTYSTSDNSDNTEYFMLMFNSDIHLEGELNILIEKNRFTCTESSLTTKEFTIHHPGEFNTTNTTSDDVVDSTFLHQCIVGNIRALANEPNAKVISYSIMLDKLYITQSTNPEIDKLSHLTLFSGIFRMPYYEQSFQTLVIGDWGQLTSFGKDKGYIDPLPCIIRKLQENPNIVMIVFTGDIAYDLQGPKYYSMLRYLEPITSRLIFLAAPGNHDTLYHADTFLLYTQTFYTPQWRSYFNYFNKIKLGRLLFISYNPEQQAFDFEKSDRLNQNLTKIFEKQLTPEVIESIKQQYYPIVFSHYPIYCSDINDDIGSCEKNLKRFKVYRDYFNKIDMKLYLSGHVHLYERTHAICNNGTTLFGNQSNYDMSCPIYIVEGAGGCDSYLQTKSEFPPKNFSASLVYNSGFGILTINSKSENSYPDEIRFEHISTVKCEAADHFQMINTAKTEASTQTDHSNSSHFGKIIYKTLIICTIAILLAVAFYYVRRRYKHSSPLIKSDNNINQENHVEMVEQNFEAPQSDKPQNNQTS